MTTGPDNPYGEQQPPQQPPNPNPYYPQHHQQPHHQQQPYGYPQAPYGQPPLPNHPSATTAMVLGIIGLAGVVACGGITLVLSPFAWAIGAKASHEIKAHPGTYGGEGSASAGKIMGIIGTVLLILAVLAVVAFIVIAIAVDSPGSSSGH
ncbi:hypothetical protein GCM10027062_21880 [Nocardioides hungaricus]